MSMFLLLYGYTSVKYYEALQILYNPIWVSTDTDVEWKWGSVLWGHNHQIMFLMRSP